MRKQDPPPQRPRGLPVAVTVWAVAIGWSIYLVEREVNRDAGAFAMVVQIMGSLGILFALFFVMRSGREESPEELEQHPQSEARPAQPPSQGAARWAFVTLTIALALGGLLYQVFSSSYLHQTALFFVGVPAVLAVTLALTPKAKSATGSIIKGLTVALLLSGIVFAEGFVCILMAAPLFYLIGAAIGITIDHVRRHRQRESRVYSIVGVAVLLLSLEGATPATSFSQHEVIVVNRTVAASTAEVQEVLSRTPDFDRPLPFYLRLGFPRPIAGQGEGLEVGDRRTILFGNESPMEPMSEAHHGPGNSAAAGTLELKIIRSEPGLIVFKPVLDATAFTHWISWGRSVVRWRAIDSATTEISWALHFDRQLSPSWYFGPWQRYAGEKAVEYLVETIATP